MKRGPKPKGKVKIEWSADFAYAIGLIASDGYISRNSRHIGFDSKDLEQINNFMYCLGLDAKIGLKKSGTGVFTYRVQMSDSAFSNFLQGIGIGPAKSKTIRKVDVPDDYFFDFLRGLLDGDGYIHSYFDPRWKSSFLWYLGFCSASLEFLEWIRNKLSELLKVRGHITKSKMDSCLQLKYAKTEAEIIVGKMYEDWNAVCLSRKKLKISSILSIVSLLEFGRFDRNLAK